MILLNLDHNSNIPLFRQVLEQFKQRIDNNTLRPGDKLPSTRNLSDQLGVNRTTVYKAYQELWALGYIESRSGSYSYVRQRRDTNIPANKSTAKSIDWSERVNPSAEYVHLMFGKINYPFSESIEEFDGTDFGRLHPDTRIFPVNEFKKSLGKVITNDGKTILDYGEGRGFLPLREYIAHRLRLHSISVSADEILITNGAQNAIDLLLKLLATPGSRVFVESPTYGMIIPTLTYYNCEIVPIPMAEEGIDLVEVEKELKKEAPIF
ncbi:PLP-dependent aminotransferase family protein, partial [Bacteroidota bacterium]